MTKWRAGPEVFFVVKCQIASQLPFHNLSQPRSLTAVPCYHPANDFPGERCGAAQRPAQHRTH